jgi:Predicted Rossmann fold nucleotide-binding protein
MSDSQPPDLHSGSVRRPVAYKNEAFLDSDDARVLRIASEYLQPLTHFRDENIHDTIVFFGSARLTEEGPMGRYYNEARELARMVTEWSDNLPDNTRRFVVCTGGGPGIMEAANRGAQDANGKTIGLNIGLPSSSGPTGILRRSSPSNSSTSSCANSGLRIWPRRWWCFPGAMERWMKWRRF